ncbi:MAG: deoxyhypusine synthase [Candidatus Diapherotrites archaeon]|nr:deoxyhypusine synthase [Candidatus Diapherotrites archaeon]
MSSTKNIEKQLFKKSVELGKGKVKGYSFEGQFNVKEFFESFKSTGFQASNLGSAIGLCREMRRQKAKIFFGFTSNMASCGVRESITYLVKNNLVDFLVTTTGGVEEDIIKTHKHFLHGDFEANGAFLRGKGINRTGNIFIPNERYIWFEQFVKPVFERLLEKQKSTGKPVDNVEFVQELARELEGKANCEESFVYWAFKNKIPLLCVPLADGAIGDHIYLFKKKHKEFLIDLIKEVEVLYDSVLNADKVGAIIIGGSVPKHHIMNACMLREGADFTVYINTGIEAEGSNAGANPEEAKSWGKAAASKKAVKVWCEASIAFPILVAAAFKL